MASFTKITSFRRAIRAKNLGKARKARLNKQGTTPPFPIHTEASHANAPEAQLPKKKE